MKKISSIMALVCLGMASIFTSAQAMHITDALAKKTALNLFINFFDSGRRYAAENQELFQNTCQKMGMDAQKIEFKLGKKCGSYAKKNMFGSTVILGLDDQRLPIHEREFVIAHELAHIKNNDRKEGAIFSGKVAVGALGLGTILERLGSRCLARVGSVKGRIGQVALSGVCHFALPLISVKIVSSRLQKQQEKRADLTAIVALHDNQGALDCFSRNCHDNKKIRNDLIKQGRVWYACRHIDEQGNNVADKDHPLLTERLAYCKTALLKESF